MSNYLPPDGHLVHLNFTETVTGTTDFNFGESGQNYCEIDAVIDTAIAVEITVDSLTAFDIDAVVDASVEVAADILQLEVFSIDASINTSIDSEITAYSINEFFEVDAVVINSARAEVDAEWNIDHNLGVSYGFPVGFNQAITICARAVLPWSQPILMAQNGAIYFEDGLVIGESLVLTHDAANHLSQSIHATFEQGTGLNNCLSLVWQEAERLLKTRTYVFEGGETIAIQRIFKHQEMLKGRRAITISHQVAEQLSKTFSFAWDKGLEIVTQDKIRWEDAYQIHYRKHPIKPMPPPERPKYTGSTDLVFNCLCHEIDSANVVLNFGADDCFPQRPLKKWWYILNSVSVTRLDNNEPITVIDGTYETGRDRWCWTYSLTLAPDQLHKLASEDDVPVVLKIMVNGFEHHMLVEGEPEQTRRFAQTLYRLNGRSRTALDSSTYASTRSFLQENERRAEQLCQAELDRVFSDTLIDWQLLEETGWVVPTQSLTYANLAPLDAIKLVVEAGGGFIYSQKASKTLSILPKYKKGYWDAMQLEDYDLLLNESMMLQHEIKPVDHEFDYNGITLINSRNGNTAKVRIAGTSAETMLPNATNPMFTVVSMGGYGKTELCRENVKERHVFSQIPVSNEIGEMLPGKTIAFASQWWGVIDNVKGAFNHKEVWETVEVERISRE